MSPAQGAADAPSADPAEEDDEHDDNADAAGDDADPPTDAHLRYCLRGRGVVRMGVPACLGEEGWRDSSVGLFLGLVFFGRD